MQKSIADIKIAAQEQSPEQLYGDVYGRPVAGKEALKPTTCKMALWHRGGAMYSEYDASLLYCATTQNWRSTVF